MTMDTERNQFARDGLDIKIRDVSKSYRTGDKTFGALTKISCDIPSGQVTIFEGPSGCGKTTLMNIIGGVDNADRGSVYIGSTDWGAETDERKLAQYRLREVGFVFQAFNLIPGLSALDNLQLPMAVVGMKHEDRVERGHKLLSLVKMDAKAHKRPDELSGGEQQRVAIALALVNDPPQILADEPTGNLDSISGKIVTDLLCSLAHNHGKTVVIATHDSVVSARGDQRLRMRDGVFEE